MHEDEDYSDFYKHEQEHPAGAWVCYKCDDLHCRAEDCCVCGGEGSFDAGDVSHAGPTGHYTQAEEHYCSCPAGEAMLRDSRY